MLVALSVAVLGLAAYIALRPRAPSAQDAPASEPADAGATPPEPTPVGQGTPVPGAAQPAAR